MTLLLRGGRVLAEDGTTSGPCDVLLDGSFITAVGDGLDSDEVIDCSGATVMPGMVDAHVHLAMAGPPDLGLAQRVSDNARLLLESGVTTARDASGPAEPLLAQRSRCEEDPAAGPQLLLCCEGIACVGGHGTEFPAVKIVAEVDSPDAARAAVRRLKEVGADWVKVMLNGADDALELGEPELRAIVDEARQQGLPVAAHASNPSAVALAVACGVDSVEHGNDVDDAHAKAMAQQGTALVTTTYVYRAGAGCTAHRGDVDPISAFDPHLQEQVRSIMAVRVAAHEKALPAAKAAGTRIVMGTDAVTGPIDLAVDELLALTELGLTPADALRAATVDGAALLGLADRGRVAVGARADLLVVPGRPDHDLTTLRRPLLVLRTGTVVVDNRV